MNIIEQGLIDAWPGGDSPTVFENGFAVSRKSTTRLIVPDDIRLLKLVMDKITNPKKYPFSIKWENSRLRGLVDAGIVTSDMVNEETKFHIAVVPPKESK